MSSQSQRSKVCTAVAAVLLLTGKLAFSQSAIADLDLPAQGLAQSLRAVATATQVNVLFDTTQIAAFKAPALKGRITVADALSRLLDGTGLTYRFVDDKTVVLSSKDAVSSSSPGGGAQSVAEDDDLSAVAEIVVTGTRIARTAFDTPVPVTAMDETAIQRTGFTNVTDILGRMPALAKGSNPNNSVYDQSNVGASFADLRGLGIGRTLTLINGRRRVSGAANSAAVDLSTIPANMIERIEVITGGAAAVYGADAVSGVLNIILKENFDGLSLGARAHKPGYSGGAGHTLSVAGGAPFSDDRGSIGFTLSYSHEDRVSLRQLPWYKRNGLPEWVGNPANTGPDDGIPDRIALRDMREPELSYGGAFEVGDTLYTVDPGLRPVQHGPILSGLSSGGDGWNPLDTNPSRAGSNSFTGMLSAKYRVAEDVRLFANADFGSARADSPWLPAFSYGVPLSRDNALLPVDVAALMDANGLDEIFVSKLHLDSGNRHDSSRRNTYTAVVGLEGEFGHDWNWQAFYQYGRFDRGSRGENYQISSHFFNAIDVIADPQTGQPVCRDESARAAGCLPISLLGRDVPSAAALSYVQHTLVRDLRNTQSVAGAQLTGELFTLPAGPAQLASGFEYRKETLSMRDDGLAVMGLIDQALGAQPVDASFNVKEAFAELVVPVAADLPLLHKASLEGAARYSSYDTIGDTTTWKLGGVWAPFRDLRFRVMRAYSVRAPNLYELFSPGVFGFGTNYDPCSAENIDLGSASRVENCRAAGVPDGWTTPRPGLGANARTGGNPNLDPETSRSWTIGAVFTPSLAPRFSVSVDYWKIEIEKAIGTVDSDTIVTRCYDSPSLDNPFCPNITRGTSLSPSEISLIDVTQINVGHLLTDGVDLAAVWSFDAASVNARWPGSLTVSLSGTYLRSFEELVDESDPTTLVVTAGEVQHPKWRVNASVAYEQGRLSVDWGLRYVGASDFDVQSSERYGPSGVSARMYTDLVGTYRWSSVEAQLGVNNLLGTEPPLFVGQNGGFYDIGGRMVFASVTMKL